jgi:hypothetical protein
MKSNAVQVVIVGFYIHSRYLISLLFSDKLVW